MRKVVRRSEAAVDAPEPGPDRTILQKIKQHLVFKTESEALKARADVLRDSIMDYLESVGTVDDKGHSWLELPEPIVIGEKSFTKVKRERKAPTAFDEEAAEILLHSKGLLARAQRTVYTITSTMAADESFIVYDGNEVHIYDPFDNERAKPVEDARIEQETLFDQNEVYVMQQEGLLTEDELDSLLVTTESFAYKPVA